MLRERVRKPSAFKQGMNGLFCPNLRQGVRVILIENERTARKLLSSFSLLYLFSLSHYIPWEQYMQVLALAIVRWNLVP